MWWLPWLALACGPVDPDAARAAYLAETLVRADAPWLSRDPALLEAKYRRMAADPYDYLRGSLPVYWADQTRIVPERRVTSFLNEPGAGEILLFGDAHPENLGTGAIGDRTDPVAVRVTADMVDLDGAAHGPWLLDVRRSALAMWTLGAVDGCDVACREGAVSALARAYVDELLILDAGEPPSRPSGALVLGMVAEAASDGPERKEHAKRVVDGRLFTVDALPASGEGTLRLDAEDAARATRLLASYGEDRPGFRVLDVARRYGQGVASMPAIRFVVLYDRGDPAEADDDLLQIREVIDSFAPTGVAGVFPDPAQRGVEATRWLQVDPDGDPALAGLRDGAQAFKVRGASSWHRDLEHVDVVAGLADGSVPPVDVAELAAFVGRRLADGHAQAPTASGRDALPILLREVEGREDALVDELVAGAAADHAALARDLALFQGWIDTYGERLGAERLAEDVR